MLTTSVDICHPRRKFCRQVSTNVDTATGRPSVGAHAPFATGVFTTRRYVGFTAVAVICQNTTPIFATQMSRFVYTQPIPCYVVTIGVIGAHAVLADGVRASFAAARSATLSRWNRFGTSTTGNTTCFSSRHTQTIPCRFAAKRITYTHADLAAVRTITAHVAGSLHRPWECKDNHRNGKLRKATFATGAGGALP